MPTINKIEKKPHNNFHAKTPTRELRQKAYNSTSWRKLRLAHIKSEPLCQRCLANGIVKPADHVHHKESPFRNGEVDWTLMLDPSNLESICAECHALEHNREETPEETIAKLDALLNNCEDSDGDDDKRSDR